MEKIEFECPFCKIGKVIVIKQLPVLQTSTSQAGGNTKRKYYYSKEIFEVQEGCENCGKTEKEIEKILREGIKSPKKEKKILERLKKQGLSCIIISNTRTNRASDGKDLSLASAVRG